MNSSLVEIYFLFPSPDFRDFALFAPDFLTSGFAADFLTAVLLAAAAPFGAGAGFALDAAPAAFGAGAGFALDAAAAFGAGAGFALLDAAAAALGTRP